jgi:hypothetical protein
MRPAILVILFGLLVGCSPSEPKQPESTTGDSEPVQTSQNGTQEEPPETGSDNPTDPVGPDGPVLVENDPPDWKAEDGSPAQELADKVDDAFRNIGSAYATTSTVYQVPAGKGRGPTEMKFSDSDTFVIDFFEPETRAFRNRIIADGTKTRRLTEGGWTQIEARPDVSVLSEADVEAFPTEFFYEIFARFTEDRDVFGPLVSAWLLGRGGYDVTVEESTQKVNNKDRQYYQITAKTEENGGAEVKIRIDGVRFVPVAVQALAYSESGSPITGMWSASWAFNGKHDPSEFEIPVED